MFHVDGLVQERRNSIADALELRLSCANPSISYLVVTAIILQAVPQWLKQSIDQNSNTWKTPHSSPMRVSYGVSVVRIWDKLAVEMAPYCIMFNPMLSALFWSWWVHHCWKWTRTLWIWWHCVGYLMIFMSLIMPQGLFPNEGH